MPRAAASVPRRSPKTAGRVSLRVSSADMDAAQILNALPDPVLVVDYRCGIRFVNAPTQEFFDAGANRLVGAPLSDFLPADCPVFFLVEQILSGMRSVSQNDVVLEAPRIGHQVVDVRLSTFNELFDHAVITFHQQSLSRRMECQVTHRSAARSVTAMAAMLAHEVKNPLSGIRGAAQLLEESASDQDRMLTRLICDEADRIVALVNRMDAFADRQAVERTSVNVHAVLDHVRKLAQTGFARSVRFIERYDPSLPPTFANRDQLVQVFLNLVKNAAEAVPAQGGEIILSTAYQRGVRLAIPGQEGRVHLPLLVSVQDNGSGVPEDMRGHLFDPFVTTKAHGTGLGLALVAKIVGDHGGLIDLESQPRRTVFRISLPMHADTDSVDGVPRELT